MLPWSQRHLEALVVGDLIVVVIADNGVDNIDVAGEHFVKVATLSMGLSATLYGWCEVSLYQ